MKLKLEITAEDKMTAREKFFKWCRENKIRPSKRSNTCFVVSRVHIVIQFGKVKFHPREDITVYFREDGSWIGGTNWLWDDQLPWVA